MSPASSCRPRLPCWREELQYLVVLVGKGILPLAVHAQRAARGHRAAHESLDAGFLAVGVIAQIALALVEIGHQQGLPVADDPAHQSPARQNGDVGRNLVAQTEGRGQIVGLAFLVGQEQYG